MLLAQISKQKCFYNIKNRSQTNKKRKTHEHSQIYIRPRQT